MSADLLVRGVCLATLVLVASPAWSGWGGGHGVVLPSGGAFHGGGGFRAGGFHGGPGGPGGIHSLPPIAGTIHERGNQAYVTSYGHANTAVVSPWSRRAGIYEVGRGQGAGYGQQGHWAGYGQQQHRQGYGQQRQWDHAGEQMAGSANGFGRERFGRERAEGRLSFRERLRFAELRRARGFAYGGYGSGGYGSGGYGGGAFESGSDDSGDVGSYPAAGTYGSAGSYADAATYGSAGTYPAPGVYGSEFGGSGYRYRSETPLAARYAEAPLAPSPYSGFDAGNSYADAASRDVGTGFGPKIIHVRDAPGRCTCVPTVRAMPVVYRYGIGTAY